MPKNSQNQNSSLQKQWISLPQRFYLASPGMGLRITLIGCGATGSQIALELGRIIAVKRELSPEVNINVKLIDGDIVEPHNIGKQAFISDDLGKNKAMTLAVRLNRMYATSAFSFMSEHLTRENIVCEQALECNFIITAVDTISARMLVSNYIENTLESVWLSGSSDYAHKKLIAWIDCGNNKGNGQVYAQTINGLPLFEKFEHFNEDTSISCSMRESLENQHFMVNNYASLAAISMLWEMIHQKSLLHNTVYFNSMNTKLSSHGKISG